MKSIAARFVGQCIIIFSRLITAVRGIWVESEPSLARRVYFSNHSSNGDFILLWTVLPRHIRRKTRPVAGSDYWLTNRLKAFIGVDVFNSVLIDRNKETRTDDPVEVMVQALDNGDSLILFPEGTRNTTDAKILPFKAGLFHLAAACPDVELVPVWIENLNRVLPKGEIIPIPFICTVSFGAPLKLEDGEEKQAFLDRAEAGVLALSSNGGPQT
ncbi:MAG: 1-acyl-sn-glycerol-3-phosphate acyltransferase [Marinosulfonomonas sp.]|nr:1-acyl-sn-glycerol-3-phosphate acyltransferase [Marinosulfonomonas sp.]